MLSEKFKYNCQIFCDWNLDLNDIYIAILKIKILESL